MSKTYAELDESLAEFLRAQPVFFVGTAPLSSDGHVNVSPKGLDTLRVLGPNRVAYLDLTGSGIETVAHLKENGRIVLMFCAFSGPPKIVRLYGKGRVVEPKDAEFGEFLTRFPAMDGARSIIVVEIERIADSCGYAVPHMAKVSDRQQLASWYRNRGEAGLVQYRQAKNRESLDGLPGLDTATREG